jgi:hypothetical protein
VPFAWIELEEGVDMVNSVSRVAIFVGAAAVVPALLTGCGSSKNTPKAAATTPPATASSASGGGGGTTVAATETEFSITLSRSTFAAGAYTFQVKNAGKIPHNLTIVGPGVSQAASPTLPGGGSGSVSVTLQKGS